MGNRICALLFDIDGVITNGKKYTDGLSLEVKSIAYKDLDALRDFQKKGIIVGCISGEDTVFSRQMARNLDYNSLGEKDKKKSIEEFCEKYQKDKTEICYIGDGKYDIEALEYVGLSVCPHDAIYEVKKVADIVLESSGGQGCIAELYTRLSHGIEDMPPDKATDISGVIRTRVDEHCAIVGRISENKGLLNIIDTVCRMIVDSYRKNGQLYLCGNGGSAADAQHLVGELVGRFYRERRAYPAEALSTNSSVITGLANDYEYNMVFARQVEAKGRKGDVLIGITTSGKSENVRGALRQAKKNRMSTVLMTGEINENLPILEYADYVIRVPSNDTPRIQEGHILIGHIMCEVIESILSEEAQNEQKTCVCDSRNWD